MLFEECLHAASGRLKVGTLEDGDGHQVLAIDLLELKRFDGESFESWPR